MVALDILRKSIPDFIGGLGVAGTVALVTKLRRARHGAVAPDGWVELRDEDGTQLLVGAAVEEAFDRVGRWTWKHDEANTSDTTNA